MGGASRYCGCSARFVPLPRDHNSSLPQGHPRPPRLTNAHSQGGFSYVYLVQDTATSETLALKKIRCPFGAESLATAMREVEAYRLFSHVPNIIRMVDYSVSTDRGGSDEGSKTVYVLLPYYKRGNLQDVINANVVGSARFPERGLMVLFLGVCRALRRMHVYEGPPVAMERMEMGDEEGGGGGSGGGRRGGGRRVASGRAAVPDEEEEGEQERPLMQGENGMGGAHIKSYAHRDIKPGKKDPRFPPYTFPFHLDTKTFKRI